MRLILTSDLHGALPTIPACDICVIAGDVAPDFIKNYMRSSRIVTDKGERRQAKWLADTFVPWLDQVPARHIVLIAGNHDFAFERRSLLPDWPANVTYLQDEGAEVNGVNFYGTPWCPNLPFWAFYADGPKLEEVYGKVPAGTDVFVTHSPPYAYGDLVGPRFGGPEHVGSMLCNQAINRVRPRMVVCGHIHEAYGYYRVPCDDSAMVDLFNVAHMTDRYEPIQRPVEAEL